MKTAPADLRLVDLTVMPSLRHDRIDVVSPSDLRVLRDAQGVVHVALLHAAAFPRVLRDVAVGAADLDVWMLRFQPFEKRLPHDAHEDRVPRGPQPALPGLQLYGAFVHSSVAVLTQGDQIVRSVSSGLPALQVVDVELNSFAMRSAALAGVMVPEQDVLPDVVAACTGPAWLRVVNQSFYKLVPLDVSS